MIRCEKRSCDCLRSKADEGALSSSTFHSDHSEAALRDVVEVDERTRGEASAAAETEVSAPGHVRLTAYSSALRPMGHRSERRERSTPRRRAGVTGSEWRPWMETLDGGGRTSTGGVEARLAI